MEEIQECAAHFLKLVNTTSYIFHMANKKLHIVSLDFSLKDFQHLAGLHYLYDLSIPKDKKKTIDWILNSDKPITDEYLAKSEFYKGRQNDEKDVEKRIRELRHLEKYLDENNFIRIYSPKDSPENNSLIICDYIIESQLKGKGTVVYIFLKHRKGVESPCCIVSFVVKKNISYGGQNLYWMRKEKIVSGISSILYQNPGYVLS